MAIWYEWIVEELDEGEGWDTDVLDVHGCDNFAHAVKIGAAMDGQARVCLVRETDARGEGRLWAYVDGGKLPETFCAGNPDDYPTEVRVPKKFHAEVARG